jgi:hypothetical protein
MISLDCQPHLTTIARNIDATDSSRRCLSDDLPYTNKQRDVSSARRREPVPARVDDLRGLARTPKPSQIDDYCAMRN